MYKIRLESVGGFGANLVGKLLGQSGFDYLNKYSRSFSSYGSEKKGSPVKSYIYFSDDKIRTNTPITEPDLIAFFTDNIDPDNCIIKENTDVVLNTKNKDTHKLPNCRLWTIDAEKYAKQCHSRINMVLLGAIAKSSGLFSVENCIDIIRKNLVANGNIEAVKCGYNEVEFTEVKNSNVKNSYPSVERYTNFGGINISNGSTVTNKLSHCRSGFMPEYIREKCIDCGLCESTCPDYVFQFKDGVNLGLDLYHCKGCLRCCEICPTKALVAVGEGEYTKNIGNIELINKDFKFDDTGWSSFVEGESYSGEGTTNKSI